MFIILLYWTDPHWARRYDNRILFECFRSPFLGLTRDFVNNASFSKMLVSQPSLHRGVPSCDASILPGPRQILFWRNLFPCLNAKRRISTIYRLQNYALNRSKHDLQILHTQPYNRDHPFQYGSKSFLAVFHSPQDSLQVPNYIELWAYKYKMREKKAYLLESES